MHDIDIRTKLIQYVSHPTVRVIEEFPVKWGYARADVVTIGEDFRAFEIKSASDTLAGLNNQQRFYSTLFDYVIVVTEKKWLKKVPPMIPPWWGIMECYEDAIEEPFRIVRPARFNPGIKAQALVGILWRNEVYDILQSYDFADLRNLTKAQLWQIAASEMDLIDLRKEVRQTLRKRRYNDPRKNK
jgi:hypothetical protein